MTPTDMQFIENLFRSLEAGLRQGFAEVHREIGEVKSQVMQMSTRMDRMGGLVNGGARAIAKLAEWSERTDVATADLLHRVADIDRRLRKLEGQKD